MQELLILQKFKNINNYSNPFNPVVQGILHCDDNISCILKELSEMLHDNFSKTESILGEELTNIVVNQISKGA
jgi:hypothetical protein